MQHNFNPTIFCGWGGVIYPPTGLTLAGFFQVISTNKTKVVAKKGFFGKQKSFGQKNGKEKNFGWKKILTQSFFSTLKIFYSKNFLDKKIFRPKIFYTKKFFDQKFFKQKNFLTKNFLDKKIFRQKNIFDQKIFRQKNFLNSKFFLTMMEPRSGIIVLINHPTTHPPAGQTCHQDCAMSPICTLNNKFALSPPLLLTHLGILCGVPTIACVIRVVQCPPTCTLKNKCVVGVCGVPPSPALQTSKYFVRCPPSYFSNILVVSLTQF